MIIRRYTQLLITIILLLINSIMSLTSTIQIIKRKFHSSTLMGRRKDPLRDFNNLISSKAIKEVIKKEIDKTYEEINFNKVLIRNTQKFQSIDINKIKLQTFEILKQLNVSNFEVDILICSDEKIKQLNYEHRGVKKATDILSFPICDFSSPGVFAEDCFMQGHLHLGDIAIAPKYITKVIDEDKINEENSLLSNDYLTDSGVSKAMSTLYSLEERLPLLMIHGILHLIGYDHETDKDWKIMTDKENEIINNLKLKQII